MRTISDHTIDPVNDKLRIEVVDAPGAGGANHRYEITKFDAGNNLSSPDVDKAVNDFKLTIIFQNGPIAEFGINGITNEALLAVVIDRLRGFQAGPYACRENALGLTKLEESLHWLHHRTRSRMARDVEGTSKI